MTDFLNKVISIILIFIMLVLAPLLISYTSTDMVSYRLILNEVTQFIDKVADRGELTKDDLNMLYLAVNSHGGAYDVKVNVYNRVSIKVPTDNGNGEIVKSIYIKNSVADALAYGFVIDGTTTTTGTAHLDRGQLVQVNVKAIGNTPSKQLLWSVLKMDAGDFNITLTGSVL